jgi:dTDP-glucose 4,6-dehydratase
MAAGMSAECKGGRLVVLGANSFAGGCATTAALRAGMTVLGISRSTEKIKPSSGDFGAFGGSYTFLQRDLNRDLDAVIDDLRTFRPAYVIDLAGQGMVAESWRTPEQWYRTNVVSKVMLLDVLREMPSLRRYIRVSTPEVYGNTDGLVGESLLYQPSTPYAVSHAAIDMHISAYVKHHQFPAILTRFSNFYGPGQQLYRIIPRTIIYAKLGRKLPLQGGGNATRAFIYGDDIGSALLAALGAGRVGEVYHFSTDRFITIRKLVEKILALLNLDFDDCVELVDDRPGKDMQYLMSDAKARSELNWTDTVPLETGLMRTIAWVCDNWAQILHEPLEYRHQP